MVFDLCENIFHGPYFIPFYGWSQIVSGILIILWHKRKQIQVLRAQARKAERSADLESSDEASTRLILLPVYGYYLYMLVLADFLEGVVALLFRGYDLSNPNPISVTLAYAGGYGVYHFVIEGLMFLLLQNGAGLSSFRRSILWALLVAVYSFGMQSVAFGDAGSDLAYLAGFIWELSLLLFYLCIWLLPAGWLHRRPASRPYAIYWTLVRGGFVTSSLLRYNGVSFGYCVYDIDAGIAFGILKPFVVFHTLLQDSHYWRGLLNEDKNAVGVTGPLTGISLQAESAHSLAIGMDAFKQKRVPVLNHAFLSLGPMDTSWKVIGVGGSCRVYEASYKGKPVAVKMVWCVELTPSTIRKFMAEASLLHQLHHENVVQLVGVCVRPPSLCLVMELCEFGSLYDVLHPPNAPVPPSAFSSAASQRSPKTSYFKGASTSHLSVAGPINSTMEDGGYAILRGEDYYDGHGSKSEILPSRQRGGSASGVGGVGSGEGSINVGSAPILTPPPPPPPPQPPRITAPMESPAKSKPNVPLTWRNRLLMALQCAQAVAFLHKQNPPLLHLDLKPQNFLVARSTVEHQARTGCPFQIKVSDMELALSYDANLLAFSKQAVNRTSDREGKGSPSSSRSHDTGFRTISGVPPVPDTLNWVAPELLDGNLANASVKSDVYSLALVFYEILTLRIPYSELTVASTRPSLTLSSAIKANYRPPLPGPPEDPEVGTGEEGEDETDTEAREEPDPFPTWNRPASIGSGGGGGGGIGVSASGERKKYGDTPSVSRASVTPSGTRTKRSDSAGFSLDGPSPDRAIVDPAQLFVEISLDAPSGQLKRFVGLIRAMWHHDCQQRPFVHHVVDAVHQLCVQAQSSFPEYLL